MKEPERNFSPESIDQLTGRFFNELSERDSRLITALYQAYSPSSEENSRSLQRIWSRFAQAQALQEGQTKTGSVALTQPASIDAPVPGSFQRPPQPLARRSRRSFWWRFSGAVCAAIVLLTLVSLVSITHTSPVGNPQTALGASLTLDGSPQFDQHTVFLVKSSEGSQYLAEISFDAYNGRTWSNTAISSYQLPTNQQTASEGSFVHLVTQQITVINPPGELQPYIFGAGQIASVNQAATVLINKKSGSEIAVLLNNGQSLAAGEQYTIQSYVSSASVAELSSIPLPAKAPALPAIYDGMTPLNWYSSDILHTYLQLPAHLDPRILATAQQATAGAKSMYDMAVDLESYLRNHYTYNTSVTMPPGQEGVSWFLFHSGKQGFCNYFATTMAVMARELGMPARVVVGYTAGTYDTRTQEWVVRGTDAHAWAQIYFAGYGWINFEPSASFSSFVRPL